MSANQRPLRILQVTARYFPMMGGVENHVYQVARRFVRDGVESTVLTTDPGGSLPTDECIDGVRIHRVRAYPADRDYYLAPDIYPIVRNGGWDIVHIQCYHTLVPPVAMLAALHAKIPYVLTFHGGGSSSRVRNALRGVQQQMLRPLLARADRLIATARWETAFYSQRLRLPTEQFVFIPNGSDISIDVAPAPPRAGETLIASVGRLERYKGHQHVIAAMPKVLEQQPDARLWIAGTGPYEPELRRLAQRLGVSDRVEIRAIPPTERDTMATELSRAALMTLMSEYETHPMAVLEALALGRPVLVANTPGLSEIAERGMARAIPLNSTPEQVATAMLAQIRAPIRPAKFELPTWDECATELLQLYSAVIGRSSCVS